MTKINRYNVKDLTLEIPVLNKLDTFIVNRLNSNNDFERIEKIDKKNILSSIIKGRKFAFPSSIYGHRFGSDQSISWNLRPNTSSDSYITDSRGILKNNLDDLNVYDRILNAKKKNLPVILMFGGSTMMSMGGSTPNFSIPSLVEGILKAKYDTEVVCINYGLGGTCSREALDLYIHDARELIKSANVVFYDGWNCSTYLTQIHRLRSSRENTIKNLASAGDTYRTTENNFVLLNFYSLSWHLKRVLSLFVANIFSFVATVLFKKFKTFSKNLQTLFSIIQNKLFTTPHDRFKKIINNLDNSDKLITAAVEKAVVQYIDIHECTDAVCKANNSKFVWMQQPTVYWGNKPLTDNELEYKHTNWGSDNVSNIYSEFEDKFSSEFKSSKNNKLKESFYDLTGEFDAITKELYLDTGHLNMTGNLVISAKIANILFNKKDFLK